MLKRLLKFTLQRSGYQLARIAPASACASKCAALTFGPYTILTEVAPLLDAYRDCAEMNAMLGRLVTTIVDKYPNASMIDVGAHCGDTIAIAKCAADLPVLAIEGDSTAFARLGKNIEQFSRVTAKQAYVGEVSGPLRVRIEKQGWNSTLVPEASADNRALQVETLDTLCSDWPEIGQVRVIKCDVEGFDVKVLFGARQLIAASRPVLFFEYNREAMLSAQEPGLRVFDFLQCAQYNWLVFYDAYGRFLLATTTSATDLLHDLHFYADGIRGKVGYYDIVAFPRSEDEVAHEFIEAERAHREK